MDHICLIRFFSPLIFATENSPKSHYVTLLGNAHGPWIGTVQCSGSLTKSKVSGSPHHKNNCRIQNKHDVKANYTRTMMSLNAMSHCALLPGSENMRAPVHGNQLLNHKKMVRTFDEKNLPKPLKLLIQATSIEKYGTQMLWN